MPPPSADPLAGFPIRVRLPVQWGEMDAYGHVNNAVLFRYFETGRIAYLERIGFIESQTRDGVGAILHSTHCRFRRPLHFPDTVIVGARGRQVEEDRFTMDYVVVSERHGALAAEGGGVIVSYDYRAGEKTPIPETVRRGIAELEGEA